MRRKIKRIMIGKSETVRYTWFQGFIDSSELVMHKYKDRLDTDLMCCTFRCYRKTGTQKMSNIKN